MPKPTFDEYERLEKALRNCERSLELHIRNEAVAQKYLDIAGVVIVVLSPTGEVTFMNLEGCRILGYTREEVAGKNWFKDFLPERMRGEVLHVFQRLLTGGTDPFLEYENPVLTKRGDERIMEWRNTLVSDESGRITGTLSSGKDVTLQVRAEEALRKANQELSYFSRELERMVQERTEALEERNRQLLEAERLAAIGKIVNRIAHELRNPLTVAGGFARRLWEKTPDESPDKSYLKIILGELTNLERRLSEILKIEKLGEME